MIRYALCLLGVMGLGGCAWMTGTQDLDQPNGGLSANVRSVLGGGSASSRTSNAQASSRQGEISKMITKGKAYEKAGQWDKARKVYEKALSAQVRDPRLYRRLAIVADHQRRYREAQTLLTKALQLAPRDATLFSDLGYCFFLQGKLAKAESSLQKATRLAPTNARAWNNLGMVYGHQKQYNAALSAFRQVGSEADAQYNLAFVFASQEKPDAARACFQRALNADPTYKKAQDALASFNAFDRAIANGADPEMLVVTPGYVPFVEKGATTQNQGSGVQQASYNGASNQSARSPSNATAHATTTATTPKRGQAGNTTRALQERVRAMMQRRIAQGRKASHSH